MVDKEKSKGGKAETRRGKKLLTEELRCQPNDLEPESKSFG